MADSIAFCSLLQFSVNNQHAEDVAGPVDAS